MEEKKAIASNILFINQCNVIITSKPNQELRHETTKKHY